MDIGVYDQLLTDLDNNIAALQQAKTQKKKITVLLGGYSAEGGLAKILIELGVPGFLACLWMAAALIRACLRSLRRMIRQGMERRANVATGLLAFLATNVLVFATASQVFGDSLRDALDPRLRT